MSLADKKDLRILAELDFDARAPLSQIARNVRSSKQLVKYRMDEMQRKGLINNTFAALDYFKLGYTCFYLFIKLKDVTRKREEAIIAHILQLKHPKNIYSVGGGRWDLLLQIWVRDIRELQKVIRRIHLRYGANIRQKEISIVTRFTYFSHAYIHGVRHAPVSLFLQTDVHEINKKERKLLSILERSGREANTQIAKRIGYSPETVRRKIRDFRKAGLITSFRVEIDSSMLDFLHFKLFIRLRTKTLKRLEQFINYLATFDSVLYVAKSIEMSELELNIFATSHRHFYEVINQIRYTYPDIMEHFYWNVVFLLKSGSRGQKAVE